MRNIAAFFGTYFILSVIGSAMVYYRIVQTGEFAYLYLIWNLFLAWVPFIVALMIVYIVQLQPIEKGRKALLFPLGFVWLFFYPNAPYILTDYIHMRGIPFYVFRNGRFSEFNTDLLVWYDFLMNSLFILTGFLLGFASLFLLHQVVKHTYGHAIGWGFVGIVLYVSSFGIYLGRFIRWNTWDIIANPSALLRSIVDSLHMESFAFTMLFGSFLLLMYAALTQLMRVHTN